jgi:undecaprenyl pyrophosphate synthase
VSDPTSSKTLHVAASHPLGALTAEEAFLFEKLNPDHLPKHLAVIMDGNGRWAQRRHLPQSQGIARGRRRRESPLRPVHG